MSADYSTGGVHHNQAFATLNVPLTMACWFNVPNLTGEHILMARGDFDTNNFVYLAADGTAASDPVWASIWGSGGNKRSTSGTYTANTWQHACGVYKSTSGVIAYHNGIAGSEATVPVVTMTGLDYIALSSLRYSNAWYSPTAKKTAEAAMWSAELTASEIASLAQGRSPKRVRPQSLVFYAPLINSPIDVRDARAMTVTGTVGWTSHPRTYR